MRCNQFFFFFSFSEFIAFLFLFIIIRTIGLSFESVRLMFSSTIFRMTVLSIQLQLHKFEYVHYAFSSTLFLPCRQLLNELKWHLSLVPFILNWHVSFQLWSEWWPMTMMTIEFIRLLFFCFNERCYTCNPNFAERLQFFLLKATECQKLLLEISLVATLWVKIPPVPFQLLLALK